MDLNVEFLSAESWDEEMPARVRWLQQHDPVHWSEKDEVWVLSKYEDVAYVSKNQQLFTSEHGVRPHQRTKLGLIDEGEPRHGQLRNLINRGFSPRMVKKLEAVFREITNDAIDAVAKQGNCDFVEDIAVPLPLLLIAEMIGIRKEDRQSFHEWSDAMIAGDGNFDNPAIMAKAVAAYMAYSAYVTGIIDERRREPKDDLVSILVGANDDGTLKEFSHQRTDVFDPAGQDVALANSELVMLLVLLMVAGNETTRNALSGGMQLLIENPDVRKQLIDDPSKIAVAVEEMVRLVSPVHSFGRTVTEDTEIRGVPIEKGQQVLMLYPAANRDPDAFEDPDTFLIDRNPQHLGFGIGKHFCLGANLARMELRVAFEELLRRLPDMEYAAGGPILRPSALVRSCVEMRVKFTPET